MSQNFTMFPVISLFVVYLLLIGFAVLVYLLQGFGMRGICRKLGLRCGWMGFVPVCNMWQLGKVAEQASLPEKRKVKWSKVLLITGIALIVISIIASVVMSVQMTLTMLNYEQELEAATDPETVLTLLYEIMAKPMLIMILALFPASMLVQVLEWICYAKLYSLFCPRGAATGLTVLSVLCTSAIPFIVFAIRNRTPILPQPNAVVYSD